MCVCLCTCASGHSFFQVDSGFSFSCLNVTSTTDYSKMTLLILDDSLKWNNEPSKLSLWNSEGC